jgi:hypothetical protein
MTQDQPGQAQGTDYVVRGEVVPDDKTEAFEAEQSGPMTRLRKVASALRGDQADQTVPQQALPDQTATSTGGTGLAPGYGSQADTAESVPAGRHAAAENAGLRPGEATDRLGDFGDIAFGNLLPDAAEYDAQWQQIQFRFVDDPEGSVTEAAEVVSQVTTKLEAAIQERQRAIEERQRAIQERASALRGRWGEGSNADTETLRETLRMYRAFMTQLIGSTS